MGEIKKKKKSNVQLNFDKYLEEDEIEFKVQRGASWIKAGQDEKFFDDLVELRNNNAMHNSILKSKELQVVGQGFYTDNKKTQKVLDTLNGKETGNQILRKVAYDFETFGGFALAITFAPDWINWTSIAHIPLNKIRATSVNKKGKIPIYKISYDWGKARFEREDVPSFNYRDRKTKAEVYKALVDSDDENNELASYLIKPRTQIFYCKPYDPTSVYYTKPSYWGARRAIRADINADVYAERALKNGMADAPHINLSGTYTDEEKLEEVDNIMYNHSGSVNAGIPFVTFSDTPADAPTTTTMKGSSSEERYNTINENVRQKILSGHRVTSPLLMGVALPGTLGNRDELLSAFNLFFMTVIKPDQDFILSAFNMLFKMNGLSELSIKKLDIIDPEITTDIKAVNRTISTHEDENIKTQEKDGSIIN